jgi:uncharacterized protein
MARPAPCGAEEASVDPIPIAPRAGGGALRLGLLADTHDDLVDWPECLERLAAAFADVDAILHCGDLSTPAALDGLAKIAPLWAVRSPADPPPRPPQLADGPRLFSAGELSVALVNALGGAPSREAPAALAGRPVDVLVFGGTHEAFVGAAGGALLVNPGSPTLAQLRSAAILELESGVASCRLLSWPRSA